MCFELKSGCPTWGICPNLDCNEQGGNSWVSNMGPKQGSMRYLSKDHQLRCICLIPALELRLCFETQELPPCSSAASTARGREGLWTKFHVMWMSISWLMEMTNAQIRNLVSQRDQCVLSTYSIANHIHWDIAKHISMETCSRTSLENVHILQGSAF
jgi:hypothetical protein